MKNLDIWKNLIKEVMDADVKYNDKVSIFVAQGNGYVVIEHEQGGLQLQFRNSLDHADIVTTEDIVVHGKMISEITDNNCDDIKTILAEFCKKNK